MTVKDDHLITKLTSGPCLMGALIAFSFESNSVKDNIPGLCIKLFSPDWWIQHSFHLGFRWITGPAGSEVSLIEHKLYVWFHILYKNMYDMWNHTYSLSAPKIYSTLIAVSFIALVRRNNHTNIWLKIERKDLYLQVKTAPLMLCELLWEIVKRWAAYRVQPPAPFLHGSVHVNFIPSCQLCPLVSNAIEGAHHGLSQQQSSNVEFVGSVVPFCMS